MQGWRQTKHDSSEQRYAKVESQDPPVWRRRDGQGRVSRGQEIQQGAIHPHGQSQPHGATGERQRQTFHQQLGDDPRPAGAQGEPDCDFLLARRGAGDLEIGDVSAGNQEHQPDQRSQHQQRTGEFAAQLGIAFRGRKKLHPHAEECLFGFRGGSGEIFLAHLHLEHLMEERLQSGFRLRHGHARLHSSEYVHPAAPAVL